MTNRPKAIGTAAETAVVRVARQLGFPTAERRALAGSSDLGDILLTVGCVIEVKGGTAAKTASDGQVATWLDETERERVNAGAAHAFLVTQRSGVGASNAARWWAHWRFGWLPGPDLPNPAVADAPVRMQLGDALRLLRAAGHGEPIESEPEDEP